MNTADLKRNSSIEFKEKVEKIKKKGRGSINEFFQASLSLEIIYTILNALVNQLNNPDKCVILKNKSKTIKKIQNMERSRSRNSIAYENKDYYDEKIFKMDKQELKNLNQLCGSEIFLRKKSMT